MPTVRTTFLPTPRKISRRVIINLAAIISLPCIFLAAIVFLSEEVNDKKELEIAALTLAEDMEKTPLKDGWTVTDIRATDIHRVEMDVEVALHYQAEFIKSRKGRIQYSYLKLACPHTDAKAYQIMSKAQSVWVRLLYNNELIVTGACPKSGRPS